MDKILFFDPVTHIYAYTTHELLSLRQKALTNLYLNSVKYYNRYKTNVEMEYGINNKRRHKGLKPLRRRTWKRLKGS